MKRTNNGSGYQKQMRRKCMGIEPTHQPVTGALVLKSIKVEF
jgi:hypothetical protein